MVILLGSSVAAAATVQILVEPRELVRGQVGRARVVVAYGPGEVVDTARPPEVPAGSGAQVRFGGSVARSNTRVAGGRIQKTVEFGYTVAALTEGTWTLGPVEIAVGGDLVRSEPAALVVAAKGAPSGDGDFEAFAGFQVGPKLVADAVVWEGQVATYRRGLRARQATSARFTDPALDGFRTLQKGDPAEQRYTIEDERGSLMVSEAQLPVVASGAGRHDLGPVTIAVQIPVGRRFGLVQTRTEVLASDPLSLTVKPLPPPPPGFSGIVGDVDVRHTFRPGSPRAGESLPFTLVVSGAADLEGLRLPDPVAPGMAVYPEEPVVRATVQDGVLAASATFQWTFVPTAGGRIDLPPYELVVFSPSEGRYQTLSVDLGVVQVQSGVAESAEVRAFGAEPTLAPPAPDQPRQPYAWGFSSRVELAPPLLAASGAALLPALALLVSDGVRAWLARRRVSPAAADRPPTPTELLRRLPDEPGERLAVLDQALRVAEAGREGDPRIRELRKRLGRARFGGGADDPELVDDVRRLCALVEREAA